MTKGPLANIGVLVVGTGGFTFLIILFILFKIPPVLVLPISICVLIGVFFTHLRSN